MSDDGTPTKCRTQTQLARALNTSQTSVSKWRRRDDWPFGLTGPWDVADVRRWRAHHLPYDALASERAERLEASGDPVVDTTDADDQPITVIDKRLKLARAKLVELQREILDGKHIERAVHVGAMSGLCGMFVGVLQELIDVLPDQLSGLPGGQIEKRLRVWSDDAIARLKSHVTIPVAVVDETPSARKRGRPRQHPGRPRANRQSTADGS